MGLDSCDHNDFIVAFDRSIYSNNCPVCALLDENKNEVTTLEKELTSIKAQLEQTEWEYENHPKETN